MATEKQKKALDNMVENGGNASKAMRDAGYSEATAKNPQKLTDSKGFQELADVYLPDDMLLGSLATDIEKKAGNRKQELELAFKIKGRMVDRSDVTSGGDKIMLIPPEVANRIPDDSATETTS